MELLNLNCNNCGAQMEVNLKIRYFNCSSCKCALELKETGNTIYTEVVAEAEKKEERIEKPEHPSKEIIENSEELLIESKIARLDRDWKEEQEKHKYVVGEVYRLPKENTSMDMFFIVVIVVVVGLVLYSIFPHPISIGILGLFFIGLLFTYAKNDIRFDEYEKLNKHYKAQRKKLLTELNQLRKKS